MRAASALLESLSAVGVTGPVAFAVGDGSAVLQSYDGSGGALWDLASLTKPLFAAPAYLRQQGGEPLAALPRALLRHAAGLPAEIPSGGTSALAARVEAEAREGGQILYSDLGYWYIGRLAAGRAAASLDDVYRDLLVDLDVCVDDFAFGTSSASHTVPAGPVREGRQLVHDPAARRLGGVSGHAGAFGTLEGVVAMLRRWAEGRVLAGELMREATSCQTHAIPGGHRSLCWTMAGDPFHPVAHDWPATTLAHTGFTGVSVAWDPVGGGWATLLTNALPVDGDAGVILRARRAFHAGAADILRDHVVSIGTDTRADAER